MQQGSYDKNCSLDKNLSFTSVFKKIQTFLKTATKIFCKTHCNRNAFKFVLNIRSSPNGRI